MEVLLVAIGAAAGLVGSLVVETYRSRREHKRWMLDRRFAVYSTALSHVDELLTWAGNEATNPEDSPAPKGQDFHEFAAQLALVGSDAVQDAWGKLDGSFRQFPMTHTAAINAQRAVQEDDGADSKDAIRLRGMLDEIVTRARRCETALAKAMERDVGRKRA